MLSEMFAHARKDLQVNTPGTSSTASLSESGSAKRRLVARPHDQPREGRNSPDAAPRVLLPDFRVLEPVTMQAQEQGCSVSSSRELFRSPASERKSMTRVKGPCEEDQEYQDSSLRKAYVDRIERLESNLRALADENRGLRMQHQEDEVRLAEMHLHMEREMHDSLQLRRIIKELQVSQPQPVARSKVGVIFDAWFRAASQAWRERWRAAERALSKAEAALADRGPIDQLQLQAEGAELRATKLEAALEAQSRRLLHTEQEAVEAQEQAATLRANSTEAARKIKVLTEQLSSAEALLVKEKEKLRHEELQARECKTALTTLQAAQEEEREAWTQRWSKMEAALVEQRMRAETSDLEHREACRQLTALEAKAANVRRLQEDAEELRRQLLTQQAAKVEAERQVGLMEVERSKVSCKLQLAESELADAKAQELRMARAVEEARAQTEEVTLRLQRVEEQCRETDAAARAAEADRKSVLFRLQQAAQEVDLAKNTAEAAGIEARQLQEILVKAKEFDGAPDFSQISELKDDCGELSWSTFREGYFNPKTLPELPRWNPTVKSYGILGRSNKGKKAEPPDENTILVDPAGLPFIRHKGPRDAKGAAQANYQWLEISEAESFPQPVKEAITEECKAKYHAYAGGKKKCIHVVGPDLRSSDGKDFTFDQAVEKLTIAYRNVFEEFCRVGMKHNLYQMRLLPLSGGIFSGPFKEDLHRMTAQAVQAAFSQLAEDKKHHMMNSSIDMCIFMESEFDIFASAFDSAPLEDRMEEGREMEEALAEIRRWRLEGTPPKMSGTALQRVLKERIARLDLQLVAARAIRNLCGLGAEPQDGDVNILPSIASAAVAAARDASCEKRLVTMEEELADAKEVQAAAEALITELFSPSGQRRVSPRISEDADGARQSPKKEARVETPKVAEATMSFTSELLEALAACRLELERARPLA